MMLLNHLWQSTLFAAFAGLAVLALRRNSARARYWLWFAASSKFLLPFCLLTDLGGHFQWQSAPPVMQPVLSLAVDPAPESRLPAALAVIWLAGFIVVLFDWSRRWLRARAAAQDSSPLALPFAIPARASHTIQEPGVFGIFRPVLLLPEGAADRLTPEQRVAILEHELCHVRNYDNLTALIQMLVEAIFWFHPLVWWLGTRLVSERERACDEQVLLVGNDPQVYAEGILSICKLYAEWPLACVSGVTGSDLKKRLGRIVTGQIGGAPGRGKKLLLAISAAVILSAPVLTGVRIPGIAIAPLSESTPPPVVVAATPQAPHSIRVAPPSAPPPTFTVNNPFLSEFARKHHLPYEATRGGAKTMYPEYEKTVKAEQ